MADLTADAYIKILGEVTRELWSLDSSAAQRPYRGSPLIIDQSEDTVNPRAFVDATVVAPTDVFIGIADEGLAVGAGDPEAERRIQVLVGPTIVGFKSAVFTNADLGKTVYMSDSGTLSTTAADNPQIGILHRVEDGYVYIELVSPQICAGA